MRNLSCLALLTLAFWAAPLVVGADAKANADPLAAFTEEQLLDPGFCFTKFVEALGAKNAALAKAFLSETPRAIQGLDLNKEADRDKLLGYLSRFAGASIIKLERVAITRQSVVTYGDAKGAQKTVRMEMQAGKWKIVLD